MTDSKTLLISEFMESCGVTFGTSGARGLVTDMTDEVCYAYTAGFLQYLEQAGELPQADRRVAVAGDLRSSTDRIMAAVCRAILDRGYKPVNAGKIPSPAVALYGIQQGIPAIMVTGSHIPDDRNGIKYNKASGEVLKQDEAGMKTQTVTLPDCFDDAGMLVDPFDPGPVEPDAEVGYVQRWLNAFPADFLKGIRLGLYQHSAVGRDILARIYRDLGAEVILLGFSDQFLPVDTEAIRPEDVALAAGWAEEHGLDVIVSTDGDSDRPLVSDETGKWLRGDVAGILCAQYCGADAVVTPVSCNTAVEKCGTFSSVHRTRIGSPYVIAGMLEAVAGGAACVVGYEANGGFLTASAVNINGASLSPLPTRDAVIIHLGIIGLAAKQGIPISQLLAGLPQRFTASDRLKEFPSEESRTRIQAMVAGGPAAIAAAFPDFGDVVDTNTTDGLRITFASGEIVHLRPSGNAPELRCYTEADTEDRALEINRLGLEVLEGWR